MTFPFPSSPSNGQQVTHTLSDGSVLVATYDASKNDWKVERQAPNAGNLILKANVPYVVPAAGDNNDVLTWDSALKQWVPRAPVAGKGGDGATYAKASQSTPDTSSPPPGSTDPLRRGALQSTVENLHKELKVWDGAGWTDLFTEDSIKQWIAAGSLFRSTLVESGINPLPTPANTNRGYYWTWAGASGYVVKPTDIPLAPDLTGEVLNPGDWLQSDGTQYVHVSGDLLSKQRWLSLGSFLPWSDTSWESGSVVSYQKAFFRSTRNIVAGDPPPGDGSTGNPWTDITPLPLMGLEDLKKVNANVADPDVHGAVLQWDDNVNEWVASDVLTIGAVKFDELGDEITGFASADFTESGGNDGAYVPSVYAVKEYVKDYVSIQPKPFLEELEDCTELATATDGQAPVWSDINSRWEPKSITAAVSTLTDVTLNTPATGNLLRFDTDHWENWVPDYLTSANGYTRSQIDTKFNAVTTALAHKAAVLSRADTPPAVPVINDTHIVGETPTGAWTGHANELARWDGTVWVFELPRDNETHLVEDVAETWHWNGTNWVKVAAATTAPAVSPTPVGTILQSMLTTAQFQTAMGADGAKWRLAAGGDCTGTAYATLTGTTTLPDLRGAFLRMAGQSLTGWNGGTLNAFTEDSTKRPNQAFTGQTNQAGVHAHTYWSGYGSKNGIRSSDWGPGQIGWTVNASATASEGAHSHTTAITGGGDAETKPKSYSVNYFIKVN